ncbi:MAG: OmpA family protein [Desulfobulbaceae bacterium]|nr:OmpA family protein [Desulfobulbaceae bacterium]
MANHVVSCSSRLAAQNRQIGDLEKQLAEQAEQLQERAREIAAQTEQFSQCARQSAEQTALLATAEAANARLSAELHQLRAEKETAVEQMNSTHQALIRKMKSEIDNGQITISELQGKLTVNLIDAILFDSGRAEIKAQGLLVLQKVVDILKEVSGKTIRIEGHTDNVPIGGGLAQKYPSNWELAAARAVNVARFLQDHGIDPHSLNAVAHGEYKPVAANDTEPGRARNRRIEIVLANQE